MHVFRKLVSIGTGVLVHLWSFPASKSFEIHFLYLRHLYPNPKQCLKSNFPHSFVQVYLCHTQKDTWHFWIGQCMPVWNANKENMKFSGNLKLCLCTLTVNAQICLKIHMINTFTYTCMLATWDSTWLAFCLKWIAIFGSFHMHKHVQYMRL